MEGEEGLALSSTNSSLTLVALPPLVDIVRVADLPAFLMEWNKSIRVASLSPIFCSESEQIELWRMKMNLKFDAN